MATTQASGGKGDTLVAARSTLDERLVGVAVAGSTVASADRRSWI
jgi:hypothetical protein